MFSSPVLNISPDAVVANWRVMQSHFTGEEVAAVVKANAYGLGAIPIAQALADAGCHSFFVATLDEAIALREAIADVRILVFHGVQPGEALAFRQHRLIPVLNSPEQMERWAEVAEDARDALSALHLDTAMARLGLTPAEWIELCAQPARLEQCRVSLILSHLACASQPDDARNEAQRIRFAAATEPIRGIPLSLANSGGIMLGREYHYALARPGCALYGIHPGGDVGASETLGLVTPVCWQAPVIQCRRLENTQEVGYGATQQLAAGRMIATVASGYADGYMRAASGVGAYGLLRGQKVSLVGRVSMDMLCFDVTDAGGATEGEPITLLGHDGDAVISIDQLAAWCGTIGYECLTRIGSRVRREYV